MKTQKMLKSTLLIVIVICLFLVFSGCVQTKREPTPITLISPANNADFKGAISLTLKWQPLVGEMDESSSESPFVEYYRVYYAMADHFYREPKIVYSFPQTFPDNNEESPPLEYKTPILSARTLYKWKVEAVLSDGSVLKSPEWFFKTGFLLQSGLSDMVHVQGGSFMMGDETGDLGSFNRPVHQVTLTYDFFIAKYETTYAEYDRYCADTGIEKPLSSGFGRGSYPVTYVTWDEAIAYCNWLSEREGYPKAYDENGRLLDYNGEATDDITEVLGYRLPTEAEWEYAARGGPIKEDHSFLYAGSNDLAQVANTCYPAGTFPRPIKVGQLKSNGLGLFDMSGNVYEWCHDLEHDYGSEDIVNPGPYYSDHYLVRDWKILRGGSFYSNSPSHCRVSRRRSYGRDKENLTVGFRIVKTGDW